MKIATRLLTFETNSSSVHTIVVLSEENYNLWQDEQLFLDLSQYYYGEVEDPVNPPMVDRTQANEIYANLVSEGEGFDDDEDAVDALLVPHNVGQLAKPGWNSIEMANIEHKDNGTVEIELYLRC